MKRQGRCLCGAVTYEFDGDPLLVFLCHCHDCQQASGSLLHFGVSVQEAAFNRKGEVCAYVSNSDEGRLVTREFCPVCGSGIDNRLEMAPGIVVIRGGTLDDPSALQPSFEVYGDSKAPCLGDAEAIKSFKRMLDVDPQSLM